MGVPRALGHAAAVAALALVGCQQGATPDFEKIEDHYTVARLQKQVNNLEERLASVEVNGPHYSSMTLADHGWGTIDGDVGQLTASWKEIKAHGAGSQLAIMIGNPTAATIGEGATLALGYNKMGADGKPMEALKMAYPKVDSAIAAGKWNVVTVDLDAPPGDIAFIKPFSLRGPSIKLSL